MPIEDETGIANGELFPDRFDSQRRTMVSALIDGMRVRMQREGQVTRR